MHKVLPNIKATLNICKTMLFLPINYGNIFLTSCTLKDMEKLQVIQSNALKCCLNIPYPRMEHVQVIHNMADVVKVKERRMSPIIIVHRAVLVRKFDVIERDRQTRANTAPIKV